MKKLIFSILLSCSVLLLVADSAAGQDNASKPKNLSSNGGNIVLNLAGKVAVVVVKSAAKTAWVTTKFAAKDLAKPILFKLLPIVTKFALRATGVAAKRLLPHAAKLAIL